MPARAIGLLALAAIALTFAIAPAAQAAGAAQVKASWVTDVATTSANLRAEVNPNGFGTIYRFEYIGEAAYEANLAAIPSKDGFTGALKAPSGTEAAIGSGESAVAVVQHIGGLKANTAYRFRLVATSSEGPAFGPLRYLATDESAPRFSLPDNRGWELVSPIDKNGGAIQGSGELLGGGVLQAAAGSNAATYGSSASFGSALGSPGASQYISRRTPSGWATENVTVPTLSGAYGDKPDGVPFQLFSTDLARGLLLDGHRCLEGEACPRSYSLRESANGTLTQSTQQPDLRFAGASADLEHVALSTCAALTPEATEAPGPEGCDPAKANLYLWSGSGLRLINLLPGESVGTPGAALAAQSQAISANGSRVYFIHAGNLYLREGTETVEVDTGVGGGRIFETAAVDGSIAFFTKESHLYRYEAASKASADLTPAGEVQGVLGASEDGSYLYYATTSGLFLRHGATTTQVAAGAADPSNYPPTVGTARVSADGVHLAFLSRAELTSYDNAGQPEAYLYDASGSGGGTLTCVSCNSAGERPLGPASIPGAIANGKAPTATRVYKPRALSANGSRLFFESFDALVPQDTNSDRDVYQWEAQGVGSCAKPAGCVNLISSGKSAEGASFLDASSDGSDALFLTDGSLVIQDPGSVDLYDARVGGGFPTPLAPLPCLGDACQALPPEPEDPGPGTLLSGTSSNPAVRFPKEKTKKKHKHHKKRHHPKKPHGGHAKQSRRMS